VRTCYAFPDPPFNLTEATPLKRGIASLSIY
jgi:hypothetical protein